MHLFHNCWTVGSSVGLGAAPEHHGEPLNNFHSHELLHCEVIMEGRSITLVDLALL